MNSLFFLLALLFAITQAAPVTTRRPPTRQNAGIFGHKSEPAEPAHVPLRRIAGIHPGAGGSLNEPSRPAQAVRNKEASVASGDSDINSIDSDATPNTSNTFASGVTVKTSNKEENK
jgi:hypothetical protein